MDGIVAVIGGSGFLGSHLVSLLDSKGYKVRIIDITPPREKNNNIDFVYGSLLKKPDLIKCLNDVSAVFLLASPPPLCNDEKLFINVNFFGTKNVIEACKELKIRKLTLTSSASVVYDGFHDVIYGDESLPYALDTLDGYTKSKIVQEIAVLGANCDDLATVALRPHGIFGPGDQVFPIVKQNSKSFKKYFMIGSGTNLVDFTFVHNVCDAHVLAMEKLEPNGLLAGKAYNITNDEPIFFWDFMSDVMYAYGASRPLISIPFILIFIISLLVKFVAQIVSPLWKWSPKMSPMVVSLACLHHYYSCERAKRDMGYCPRVSVREGFEKTKEYHGLR